MLNYIFAQLSQNYTPFRRRVNFINLVLTIQSGQRDLPLPQYLSITGNEQDKKYAFIFGENKKRVFIDVPHKRNIGFKFLTKRL
ncbi:MAG TPA: hypothetical protein DEQ02_10370 [Ruminococcaceae bacterium]|nr:hypothetical protein [Oscillospiraceae bacterium]